MSIELKPNNNCLAMLNPVACNDFVTSLFIGGNESDLKLVNYALIKGPTSPITLKREQT